MWRLLLCADDIDISTYETWRSSLPAVSTKMPTAKLLLKLSAAEKRISDLRPCNVAVLMADSYINPLCCEKKTKFAGEGAILKLNRHIPLRNISSGAHTYRLTGKSPLVTLAKEYHPKAQDKTGIANDHNLMFKHDPSELLLRIQQQIQVGVETQQNCQKI